MMKKRKILTTELVFITFAVVISDLYKKKYAIKTLTYAEKK